MQLQSDIATANPSFSSNNLTKNAGSTDSAESRYSDYKIIRRNGSIAPFTPDKIAIALTKAFIAVNGGTEAASARMRDQVRELTQGVVAALLRFKPSGGTYHIEEIQDQVELALMRGGAHEVARSYVLYREKRNSERALAKAKSPEAPASALNVTVDGKRVPLDTTFLLGVISTACEGLGEFVEPNGIFEATLKDLYDGVPADEVFKAATLAARTLIEKDPAYTKVTSRLLMHTIRKEVLGEETVQADMATRYA